MAISMKHMALITSFFGLCSFIFGVIAENKKPAAGTPIRGKGVVICKYPSDPTVILGFISYITLLISGFIGYKSVFYPYNKRAIRTAALLRGLSIRVFLTIAGLTTALAGALIIWPTLTELIHSTHNVHHNLRNACPTAKTGLLGGGAFLALNSCLFWLICLMLAANAREDYFEEDQNVQIGDFDEGPLASEVLNNATLSQSHFLV